MRAAANRACLPWTIWSSAGALLLALGCASTRERVAFESWRDVAHARAAPAALPAAELSRDGPDVAALARGALPALDENAGPSDYLTYAVLNSPALAAAFDRWKAALESIPRARALPDPIFEYGYMMASIDRPADPEGRMFGLSQMLPWPGKLGAQAGAALAEAHREQARYDAVRLDLLGRVVTAYAEYAYLGRAITATERSAALLADIEAAALARYRAGTEPYAALLMAQIERAKMEDRLRELAGMLAPAAADLNAALGRPPETRLPVIAPPPAAPVLVADAQAFAWLREGNPELRALDLETARERAALTLARRARLPDVMLGAEWTHAGAAAAMTAERDADPFTARIGLSLPLWLGTYRAGVRQGEAQVRAAAAERAAREHDLAAQLTSALFRFRDAERKADLYARTLIPKTRQGLQVARQALVAGSVGFLEIIDLQRTLLDLELSGERALADRARSIAEIETLIGRPLPRADSQPPAAPVEGAP